MTLLGPCMRLERGLQLSESPWGRRHIAIVVSIATASAVGGLFFFAALDDAIGGWSCLGGPVAAGVLFGLLLRRSPLWEVLLMGVFAAALTAFLMLMAYPIYVVVVILILVAQALFGATGF